MHRKVWTPDQIKQFRQTLASTDMLAGNLGEAQKDHRRTRRHRDRVKGVEWAKQAGLTDQTEDYLTKLSLLLLLL